MTAAPHRRRGLRSLLSLLPLLPWLLVLWCSGVQPTDAQIVCDAYDTVQIQLKWLQQAQFAGYLVAIEKGYYRELCLEVYIRPGGPTINMEEEVVANRAQFGIDWLSAFLARREAGLDVVLISQVFKRSANVEITWRDQNIRVPQDLVDQDVCVWLGGNELSLRALFDASGLAWDSDTSLNRAAGSSANIVSQSFSVTEFLARRCDAASATRYNELALVLETKNSAGDLYQMDDLFIFDYNEYNVSTFEDGLFASRSWLEQPGNRDIAVRFLRASMKGWIYGRDYPDAVNSLVFKSDVHQYWMMNEVNKLVFPSFASGFAVASEEELQASADRALLYGAIALPQNVSSFWRSDLALEAQSTYLSRSLAAGSSAGAAGGLSTWPADPEAGVLGSDDVLGNSFVAPRIHFCFNGAVLAICQGERTQDQNDYLPASSGAAIAMQVMAALSLALIALVTLLLIAFKDQKNIVAASLPFCLIICTGAAIFISSIFLSVGEPHTAMCNARVWVMGLGFVLMLSSFCIKVRRIDLIFNNRILTAMKLTNDTLFLQVLAILMVELILLALFSGLADFKVETWNDELNAKLFHTGCRMGNQAAGAALVGLLFAFKGLILLVALLLAYRTRNVNSSYNESNHLALSVYNLSFISMIVVPIVAFMDLRANNAIVVGDVGVLVAVTLSFLLLFVPKLMVAFRGTQAGQPTDGQQTQVELTRPGTLRKQGTNGQKLTPGGGGSDNNSQGDFMSNQGGGGGGGLVRSPTHGGAASRAVGVGVAGGSKETSQALWVKGLKNLSRDALLNQLRHFRTQENAVRAELKERGLTAAQVDDILASTPEAGSPVAAGARNSVFFAPTGTTSTPAQTSTTQVPTPGSQSRAEGVDTVGGGPTKQSAQVHSLPPAALSPGYTPSLPYSRMGQGSFRTSSAEVSMVSQPAATARPAVSPIVPQQQQQLHTAGSPAPDNSGSSSGSNSSALLLSMPPPSAPEPAPRSSLSPASPRRIRLHIGDSQLAAAVRQQQVMQQQQQQSQQNSNQPGSGSSL